MDRPRLEELKAYITKHETHLDKYMRPLIEPKGKRILVIGSGWGTETYWALKNGAEYVFGIDPAPRPVEPIVSVLRDSGLDLDRFDHIKGTVESAQGQAFDAIISNNVFEHVFGLSGTLAACRNLLPKKGGRIGIFTSPLFLSSAGSHLPIKPWEHLTASQEELRLRPENQTNWNAYRETLNGMTITSFLEAVREAGLWIEILSILPDRNLARYNELRDALPPSLKPMDMLLEGISCRLAFPHNL